MTKNAKQQQALDLTADQPAARLRIRSLADLAMPDEPLTDAELEEFMAVINDARELGTTSAKRP